MDPIEVSASTHVGAAPGIVYSLLADYRAGHPRILPERFFGPVTVEEGGVGAGTRIRLTVKGFGASRVLRMAIEEPEPGRVLLERDLDRGLRTIFTVDPHDGGSRVTIRTSWVPRGLGGLVERLLAPRLLQRVYAEELARLKEIVEGG
ncbi:MAG TPA: SRPBCC family protein [Longimicrobiales bacterium]